LGCVGMTGDLRRVESREDEAAGLPALAVTAGAVLRHQLILRLSAETCRGTLCRLRLRRVVRCRGFYCRAVGTQRLRRLLRGDTTTQRRCGRNRTGESSHAGPLSHVVSAFMRTAAG